MSRPPAPHRRRWVTAAELTAVAVIGLLYIALIFSSSAADPAALNLDHLDATQRMIALEHERLAGTILPAEIGLKRYGHIPGWNPYLANGTPLLNNAFNYLFNLFQSAPVLLLGGVQGSKVSVMVSLLIAGGGAWALAKALGLGAVARVTVAALYMVSGGLVGKFAGGHFQLGLSLAWPPLVLAGLYWTLKTADRRAPVLMAAAFALLFFAGNIYYTLHTLVSSAVIALPYLIERPAGRWRLRADRLRRVAVGGALALGFALVQFLPVWTTRAFVIHQADPLLEARYEIPQALANFLVPWEQWSAFRLYLVVDYSYIGPAVFLFIAGLALTLLSASAPARRHRRAAWTAFGLAALFTIWGAGQTPVLEYLYRTVPLLAEFRFTGRAHAIAALWWIVLGGVALDILWQQAREWLRVDAAFDALDRRRTLRALLGGGLPWALLLLYSMADTASRYALALDNTSLFWLLEDLRYRSFQDAALGLGLLLTAALALDTLLLFPALVLRPRAPLPPRAALRMTGVRALRLLLLVLALSAISDAMLANSRLFHFDLPVGSFARLYPFIRGLDTETPFPAVMEPFSPAAFDTYYNELRNWGLNEGWVPNTLPDSTAEGSPPFNPPPGWAIVSNEYGGASYELARAFVEGRAAIAHQCIVLQPVERLEENCDLSAQAGLAIYELTDSPPYAFVAERAAVLADAEAITRASVYPARVISHEQDIIAVRAAPPGSGDYVLSVAETNYPGWQAFIDGVPVAHLTAGRTIAIPLQDGAHTYTLRFQPPGLAAGLLGSLVSVVVAGFYLWDGRRKQSPTRQPAPQTEAGPAGEA